MTSFLVFAQLFFYGSPSFGIDNFVYCKNKKIVRYLRVEDRKDGSCVTQYTKAGVDRVVGSGRHRQSCIRFLNNVKGNLESAGWECEEKQNITMSSD